MEISSWDPEALEGMVLFSFQVVPLLFKVVLVEGSRLFFEVLLVKGKAINEYLPGRLNKSPLNSNFWTKQLYKKLIPQSSIDKHTTEQMV